MRKSNFKPMKRLIVKRCGEGSYPMYWIEIKGRYDTTVKIIALTSFIKINIGYFCGFKGISANADKFGTCIIPFDYDKPPFFYGVKNVIDLDEKWITKED